MHSLLSTASTLSAQYLWISSLYPINTPLCRPPAVTLSSDHCMAAFNSIIPRHYFHIRLQGFDPKLMEVNEGSLNFELSPNCSANREQKWNSKVSDEMTEGVVNFKAKYWMLMVTKAGNVWGKQPWERIMIVLHSISSRTDLCLYK